MIVNVKKMALAMVTIPTLVGSAPLVYADTSTVKGEVIFDKTEVREGETINLALLGLDENGEVDRFAEGKGSTIMAVIHTIKGEIQGGSSMPGVIPKDTDPNEGYFSSQVRYVRLEQGVGRVSILYPEGIAAAEETTDTVTIYLQERIPTDNGGIKFAQIGEAFEKTISIGAELGALPEEPIISGPDAPHAPPPIVVLPSTIRVSSFKPDENDPVGTSKDEDRSDGISAKMTAGYGGGKITVAVDERTVEDDISVRYGTRAAAFVILELLDEEGNSVYSDEEKIYGNEVTFTFPSEITRAGTYDMVVSLKDNAEITSTQVLTRDKVEILPQKEVCGLKLIADKERIAKPNPGIFNGNSCPSNFPDKLVCQGTQISLITLDQFGNEIDETENEEFTVSIVDEAKIVSDTALTFKVLQGKGDGIPTDNHDAILGNDKNEIFRLGTTKLVARTDEPHISDSEPLEITVVKDSLLIEVVEKTKFEQTAGSEFDAFVVRVGNEHGQVYLQDQSKTIDYASVGNKPTLDPGIINVISPAKEIQSFFRNGKDITKGLFKKAISDYDYLIDDKYFISDKSGQYAQVRVPAWKIVPAAISQVRYLDSIGDDITEVSPEPNDPKPYKTIFHESAFHLYDSYGNETSTNLGEMEAESANGRVSYVNSGNRKYGVPSGTGTIEVVYKITCCQGQNKAFSGKNEINFTFTKPGLGNNEFVIVSNIPPNPEIVVADTDATDNTDATDTDATDNTDATDTDATDNTDATDTDATDTNATDTDATDTNATETVSTITGSTITGTITPYIETISIPVNGEVALTLEKTNVEEMRMFIGEESDSLVPKVYEIDWKDIPFSAKQCEDAGSTFYNGTCQLNETQCQAANGIFKDDKCQKQKEIPIVDGTTLYFGNGDRKLLILKAGSREGRFTLTFDDTSNTQVEKILTFTVTKKVIIVPQDEIPEPSTATDKAQCEVVEGNFWDANNADDADDADKEVCKALAVLNNPGEGNNSVVLASDGTMTFTSKAQFTGGAALDDRSFKGRASMQITAKGASVLFVGSIKFDAEDVGKKADIVITVSYSLDADGNTQWFNRTSDALSTWDLNPANLEAFKVDHLIKKENLTLPLTIYEGTLSKENVVPGTLNVYIGYRLEKGLIKFGAQPIIFQMF